MNPKKECSYHIQYIARFSVCGEKNARAMEKVGEVVVNSPEGENVRQTKKKNMWEQWKKRLL